MQALEKSIFLFSLFYFSQLWRTLARKLMKRPIVFITYFQSSFQILRLPTFTIWIFFSKILWRFHYNIHFFPFLVVLRELLWKEIPILWLFSKLLWLCARSQNFVIWKFFIKIWELFQNVNNFLFIFATLSNICSKTYEKPYHVFYIYSKFHFIFTCLQNFMIPNLC